VTLEAELFVVPAHDKVWLVTSNNNKHYSFFFQKWMTYENLERILISIVTSRSTLLLTMQQQWRYFMLDFTVLPSCR